MDPTQIIYGLFALVVLLLLGVLGFLYKATSTIDRLQRQAIQEIGKKGKETIDRLDRKLGESSDLFDSKINALKENVDKIGGKNYMTLTNGFKDSSNNIQQLVENHTRSTQQLNQEIAATQNKLTEAVSIIEREVENITQTIKHLNQENVNHVEEAIKQTTVAIGHMNKGLSQIEEKVKRLSTLEEIELPSQDFNTNEKIDVKLPE